MDVYKIAVVVEKDKDGYYAHCPDLQGCYAQGETYEEVIANVRDAIKLHLEDWRKQGEDIPQSEMMSLTQLEVAV